jgi:hypothetical protein
LRETLEVAAILGMEFDASVLADVLEEKPFELLERLAGLERKFRLLRSSGKSAFRFGSRQLFDGTYEGITPALRIEYHTMVADKLLEGGEAPEGVRAYTLLRHLFLAERALEAGPFLEPALDHLAGNFHASFAAPFLEKIAEAFAPAPPQQRFAISMRLWAFYELLASRDDQMRVLADARDSAWPAKRTTASGSRPATTPWAPWPSAEASRTCAPPTGATRSASGARSGTGAERRAPCKPWRSSCRRSGRATRSSRPCNKPWRSGAKSASGAARPRC